MPAIGPRSEWLPRPYMSHFLTNKSIFYRGDPMANRKNSHRRRVRVAVLMVLCGAVFAAFFARLAGCSSSAPTTTPTSAEASSASYTVTQHAARGAIVDSAGVVLPATPPCMTSTCASRRRRHRPCARPVKAIESLTGSKDVETQLCCLLLPRRRGSCP